MGRKHHVVLGLWDMQTVIQFSLFIFLLGGLTLIIYTNSNQGLKTSKFEAALMSSSNTTTTKRNAQVFDHEKSLKVTQLSFTNGCDLFSGRWVHDNKSHYPLYKEHECPYIEGTFACQTYGRNESKYQQWRWQPYSCDFPKFDGKAIVEKLKGKRILFVGDSLNRNQWNSMICMLQPSIPGVKKAGGDLNLYTFKAMDYNISVDFYWAPMLVESNGDSSTNHRVGDRVVKIKAIEKHARHWADADILVFNSYHWWKLPVVKLLRNVGSLLDDPNNEYDEVDSLLAYEMSLKTWSKWALTHIDTSKTKLFFMGATATHSRAKGWKGKNHANCYRETEPVTNVTFRESKTNRQMQSILDSSLSKLKAAGVNVQYMNITKLTEYRKDAHTTIYKKIWHPLTEVENKNPQRSSDCSHWCLPGVPDTWNEILLAYILGR
ncbi:protein trichome birefringence-like 34 [Rutidosis leptorrhynchoides]|uniref:protein trichome birefringence-like 34 n=1 Tax=Rutidosis leptorrhynchoides TaxID=125765 RepID=UPI003A99CBB6